MTGGQRSRGGAPVAFGMDIHVDIHDYDVQIELFRRVQVTGTVTTYKTLHRALSSSGEVMRFPGKPLIIQNVVRTPLEGTYLRYRSSTGQKIGTQIWPTPASMKIPLR